MPKIQGSCLCGSLSYSSTAEEPAMMVVCHCPDCQKQSGCGYSTNVLVPASSIEYKGTGRKRFTIKGASGQDVTRNFCGECGSPIATELPAFDNLAAIKAGTLEDSSWVKPTVQIWCDSAQPWSELDDSVAKAPRNPG